MTVGMYNKIKEDFIAKFTEELEVIKTRCANGDRFTSSELSTYFFTQTITSDGIAGESLGGLQEIMDSFQEEIAPYRGYPNFRTEVRISAYDDGEISDNHLECTFYNPNITPASIEQKARLSAETALRGYIQNSLRTSLGVWLNNQAVKLWLAGEIDYDALVSFHKKV